ncbi:MAG: ribonuclease H family protein [Lachnospiraceae bacterium]|nr:ribonuclease H family protein [Lachnospiraceae bacterium]
MKTKYYAVRWGRRIGVYESWDECRAQVEGFSSALYKSFGSREEAEAYCRGEEPPAASPVAPPAASPTFFTPEEQKGDSFPAEEESPFLEIYVDGSFRSDTGEYAYGMVVLQEGEEFCFQKKFCDPEMAAMRNVAGEIRGAAAAMEYAIRQGFQILYLYYDYEGIRKWCSGEWRANRPGTQAYRDYFQEQVRGKLDVRFRKVKAHSHDPFNDQADRLAKEVLGLLTEQKERAELP